MRRICQQGFTLVELVAVIVLLGIIGAGTVSFIQTGAEAYRDVTRRDEVTQIGRFAVERVSRELRNALPGSARVSGNCIEFVPVVAATNYTAFTSPTTIELIDFALPATSLDQVAIYTLVNDDVYNGAPNPNHIASVDTLGAASGGVRTLTLSSAGVSDISPVQRIYFIDSPVSFCVEGTNLNRYSGYSYANTQPIPGAGLTNGELLAEFIQTVTAPFVVDNPTLNRNGIVHLNFEFLARGTSDEWVRFSHDVAMRNLP